MDNRPLGAPVTMPVAQRPSREPLTGRTVELVRLSQEYADDLYPYIADAFLWDYMPMDAPKDAEELRSRFAGWESSTDPVFYVIIDKRAQPESQTDKTNGAVSTYGKPLGYLSVLRLFPEHLSLEIGHVMFSSALQKTVPASEAIYLLLKSAFEDLGYRRVEWKCNSLNAGSDRAARRFGFTFEGVFRQHLVVKGRNRDTAWFSMLLEEWEGYNKVAMERWLEESNFDSDGVQRRKLEDIRGEVQKGS